MTKFKLAGILIIMFIAIVCMSTNVQADKEWIIGEGWTDTDINYLYAPQDAKLKMADPLPEGYEFVTDPADVITINNTTGEITINKVGSVNIFTRRIGETEMPPVSSIIGGLDIVTRVEYMDFLHIQDGEPMIFFDEECNNGTALTDVTVDVNDFLTVKTLYHSGQYEENPFNLKSTNTDCLVVGERGRIEIKNTGEADIECYGRDTGTLIKTFHVKVERKMSGEIVVVGDKTYFGWGNEGMQAWIEKGTQAQIWNKTEDGKLEKFENMSYFTTDSGFSVDRNGVITVAEDFGAGSIVLIDINERIYVEIVNDIQTILDEMNTWHVSVDENLKGLDEIMLEDDKNINISVKPTAKVESQVFKDLKSAQTNKKLIIETKNISWEFESNGVKNTNIDFKPSVTIANEKFDTIQSNTIKDAVFIDFGHNGELPGKATVKINIGTQKYGNQDKTLQLYYYNESTKKYEFISDAKYNKGTVTLTLEHCSTYALTNKKVQEQQTVKPEADDEVKIKTGENTNIVFYVIALTSILGVAACVKMYKN